MASNYAGFTVVVRSAAGVLEAVGSGVSVAVREDGESSDASESPLSTNSDGEIAAGTLANVDAGKKVIFRVENQNGLAGCVAQITTA